MPSFQQFSMVYMHTIQCMSRFFLLINLARLVELVLTYLGSQWNDNNNWWWAVWWGNNVTNDIENRVRTKTIRFESPPKTTWYHACHFQHHVLHIAWMPPKFPALSCVSVSFQFLSVSLFFRRYLLSVFSRIFKYLSVIISIFFRV